jgi:hypothetical protein
MSHEVRLLWLVLPLCACSFQDHPAWINSPPEGGYVACAPLIKGDDQTAEKVAGIKAMALMVANRNRTLTATETLSSSERQNEVSDRYQGRITVKSGGEVGDLFTERSERVGQKWCVLVYPRRSAF